MHIYRDRFDELKKWFHEPEILVILGPRQVGKTTLVKDYLSWVEKEKNISKSNIFAYNLDRQQHRDELADQTVFAERISSSSGKKVVFIDEIQRLENPGVFLKGLTDTMPDVKFIVTGSSSLEIRSKIADVLTGRKHVIELSPLSYNEAKTYSEDPLPELLVRGGYPAVFTTKIKEKKLARLDEIMTSYIQVDIKDFLGIEYIDKYTQLMTLLSGQIGGLVNHAHLTSVLHVHLTTLERYLSVLHNTFILDFIYPFSRNSAREIIKAPVPYFLDLGIRNFVLGSFGKLDKRDDRGLLFENFIYTEIKRVVPSYATIRYWRSKDAKEVDFIVGHELKYVPIEVKFQSISEPKVTSSMKSFIHLYKPENFIVVNRTLREEAYWNNTKIQFITIDYLPDILLSYLS